MTVSAFAPGRVNLIGDHTDYMGGPVLPMAVQFGTTLTGERVADTTGRDRLVLCSDRLDGALDVALPVGDPREVEPAWGRYPAGVAAALGTTDGFDGTVASDLPIGAGLSSSASLEVATALALGLTGPPGFVAKVCRDAEERATGVPCGIMDQLAVAAGIAGHALLIDCATGRFQPVQVPDGAAFWVVDSGGSRELSSSGYAERRAQAEAAAELVGPLPHASITDIEAIPDPVLRARARHVRTESDRVRAFAAAMGAGDLVRAGELMIDSHRSLRDDYEVSTPALDALVECLVAVPGVHGARLTGAGFGGCAVVLADPGVVIDEAMRVRPSAGARVIEWDGSEAHGLGRPLAEASLQARELLPVKPDKVELRGPRVRLRPASHDDVPELHRISCGSPVTRLGRSVGAYDPDELVWRWMPAGPFDDEEAFRGFLVPLLERPDWSTFAVEDAASGDLVGSASLIANSPTDLKVEIGALWSTPAVQGIGVNVEVCRLLIDHVFGLGYLRVEWKCHAGNGRSRAAATRLGFRFEGVQEQHSIQKGRRRDTAWFRILRDEWVHRRSV